MRRKRVVYLLTLLGGIAIAAWAAAPPAPVRHPHMTVAPAAKKLHTELERVTKDAAKKGKYNCCITPACGFCAAHMGECPCGAMVAKGKAVCRECKGGWMVGEGRVQGVKPESVKGISAMQVMDMMKSKMGKGKMKGKMEHKGHAKGKM